MKKCFFFLLVMLLLLAMAGPRGRANAPGAPPSSFLFVSQANHSGKCDRVLLYAHTSLVDAGTSMLRSDLNGKYIRSML
jgi:hypothetical protein